MKILALAALLAAPAGAAPKIFYESRAVQRGEAVLFVVEGHDLHTAPKASIFGHELDFMPAVASGTWVALYGIDLEASTGPAVVSAVLTPPKGLAEKTTVQLSVGAGNFPVETLSVAQKYVTPSQTDSERAENEAARLRQLFSHGEAKRLFEGRFDPPIAGAATARFGERRIFNGEPRAPHSGMDLKAKKGTPVHAPAGGRVVLAGPLYYSGNTIVLDHGLGVLTIYAHLSQMNVAVGNMVKRGEVIGKVGATGRVTGPHLHWALKLGGARVDPYSLSYLDLDSYLDPHPRDALKRSPLCGASGLPPMPKWGATVDGLRMRARPSKKKYARGETASILIEISNTTRKNVYVDFVRDAAGRGTVVGFNRSPVPFSQLSSSGTAHIDTEQIKIPAQKILCFEQNQDASGLLLAARSQKVTAVYDTEFLYSSSTVRAGLWRGRLKAKPVKVVVSR